MVELTFNNEKEWHALRLTHIGGSEIATLFNKQPAYMPGKYALWQIKGGLIKEPVIDNNLVKWGNRLEESIAKGLAEEYGWTIKKGGYFEDDTCPHLGASLDYIILDGVEDRQGPGILEIKNVNNFAYSKSWTDDEPPIHILLQLQHQMAATGFKWGVIGALKGGNEPAIFFYDARPGLIDAVRQKVTAFWQSLDEIKPPPMDDSSANQNVLKELYPNLQEEMIDLSQDNHITFLCEEYLAKLHEKKDIERSINELKFTIMEKMGTSKKAMLNGFKISISVTPAKPDRPALPGEIIKGRAESRRLIVKELENE